MKRQSTWLLLKQDKKTGSLVEIWTKPEGVGNWRFFESYVSERKALRMLTRLIRYRRLYLFGQSVSKFIKRIREAK